MTIGGGLSEALLRLGTMTGTVPDGIALRAARARIPADAMPETALAAIRRDADLAPLTPCPLPDPVALPLLMHSPAGWGLVVAHRRAGWVCELWDKGENRLKERHLEHLPEGTRLWQIGSDDAAAPLRAALRMIRAEILSERHILAEMASATLALNLLAAAVSLYTMQVYDRVIPAGARTTLVALTAGVGLAVTLELVGRMVRARLRRELGDRVDRRLARAVMSRLLGVRADAMPQAPGAEAQRLRGYETVRACLVGAGLAAAIDLPMALAMLGLVLLIGGWLALVPAAALVAILVVSLVTRRRIETEARQAGSAQSAKTEILVECLAGAEILKANQAGWRPMARWLEATDRARVIESTGQGRAEALQSAAASIQQTAHVALVAIGALLAANGALSMGALIACTMLLGRITAPAAALPGLVLQWGRMRGALADLDALWALPQDYAAGITPLRPGSVAGALSIRGATLSRDGRQVFAAERLDIAAGERVGVIGTVGAGKSTLLRLLAGLQMPDTGRVALDDLDMAQIDRDVLAARIGWMPQEGRLFAGNLRDNLLLGMAPPEDDVLLDACRRSGLHEAALTGHPRGLDREIDAGGGGLSGGQRQLVHLTRAMLRRPAIWLLDEPTAAMDQPLERRVIETLRSELEARPATMILATHKPQLLALCDRVVVVANGGVVMDGPRAQVVERLRGVTERVA